MRCCIVSYHISQHDGGSLLQDLEQRYSKLRVEVQMAQDAGEAVSLEEVIRRVMRKERQAAAALPGARAGKNASKSGPPIPGGSHPYPSMSINSGHVSQSPCAASLFNGVMRLSGHLSEPSVHNSSCLRGYMVTLSPVHAIHRRSISGGAHCKVSGDGQEAQL